MMDSSTGHKQLNLLLWGANGVGALTVLLLALAAGHIYHLLRHERDALEVQRRQDISLISRSVRVREQHATAAQNLQALRDTLADLKGHLPAAPNEAEFLAQLSALAEQSGVRLRNFRPGQAAAAGPVHTCEVQLSIIGTFANVCKLLDALHEVPRHMRVSRLSMSGPQRARDPCIADVSISLNFAPAKNRP
jgi:Tfp pilus assembly protein PilO